MQQMQAPREARHQAGSAFDRLGIAVDRPQRAACPLQDGAGIAAAAKSSVEIDAAVTRRQGRQHLVQHHRNMACLDRPVHAEAPVRS